MELRARPSGHRHGSPNTVSVAELVVRYFDPAHPPRPNVDYGASTTISVGSLLRREGRGPHAADRPLTPRGHSRPPVASRSARRSARKAAVAAGALVAAGAVLSGAVVDTVRTPGGAVHFASDPGPRTGSGSLQRARNPEPSRPDQHIALTAVAHLFTPAPAGSIGHAPPVSGAQIGRDASVGRDDLWSGRVGTPGPDTSALPYIGADTAPDIPNAGTPCGVGPSILTVTTPEARTPAVEVSQHALDLDGGGTVVTPQVAASGRRVTPPRLTVARDRDGGLDVALSEAAVVAPKLEVSELTAGSAQMSRTRVELPDAGIRGGSVLGTEVVTPDIKLGKIRAALPDVALPELTLPDLGVPERASSTDEAAPGQGRTERNGTKKKSERKAAESVRSAVGRLLGRH